MAMSRARESTHAWVVADDLGQAADDLRRDWGARRTPTWALDTGLPGSAEAIRELGPALPVSDRARVVAIALAQAKASRHALRASSNGLRGLESWARPGPPSLGPSSTCRTCKPATVPTPAPRPAGPSRT